MCYICQRSVLCSVLGPGDVAVVVLASDVSEQDLDLICTGWCLPHLRGSMCGVVLVSPQFGQ
jgi:hypothetical protein